MIVRAVVAETAVRVSGRASENVFAVGLLSEIPVAAPLKVNVFVPVPSVAVTPVIEPATPCVTVAVSVPELVEVNLKPCAL